MRRSQGVVLISFLIAFGSSAAQAAFTSEKCLAAKLKAAGTLRRCRALEDAKALLGKPADAAKCEGRFAAARARLDERATKAGIACRYRDNGDGTVTDFDTGLQWEKKESDDGVAFVVNPHDVDNTYLWSESGALADGSAFTELLGRLNGSVAGPFDIAACQSADGVTVTGGFAGHCDWRLPTIAELRTILDLSAPGCQQGAAAPCMDPVLGPAFEGVAAAYVSTTNDAADESDAWHVNFSTGTVAPVFKSFGGRYARGVRGGW